MTTGRFPTMSKIEYRSSNTYLFHIKHDKTLPIKDSISCFMLYRLTNIFQFGKFSPNNYTIITQYSFLFFTRQIRAFNLHDSRPNRRGDWWHETRMGEADASAHVRSAWQAIHTRVRGNRQPYSYWQMAP